MTITHIALLVFLGLVGVVMIQAKVIQMQEEKILRLEKQIGSMFGQLGSQGRSLFLTRLSLAALAILSAVAVCSLAWKLIPYLAT